MRRKSLIHSGMSQIETAKPDWGRITAILVTHHSAAVIGGSLEHLKAAGNVVVVDNASDDETLDIVRATVPQAKIVRNHIGVGYAGAANQGLNRVKTEFALTVNPDSVVEPAAVAALLDAADRNPDAAIICPQNINPDGSLELTHDVAMFERQNIASQYLKRHNEPAPEGELCAAFVSGAVNLIRMSVIHKIGGYDENILLYFEDNDLAMRLRVADHSLILAPQARIMHINAGSVRPSLHYQWEKFWNYGWARLYIEKKYHGTTAMLGLAVRHVVRFLFKALAHTVSLNFAKALRDWARLSGTLGYIFGLKAVNPAWKEQNRRWREDNGER